MIINVQELTKNNKINNKEINSRELIRIKELLSEFSPKYVSENIKHILKLNMIDDDDCFIKRRENRNHADGLYEVTLYIRLSVEDGDLIDGDVSASIRNQLLILLDECKKRGWRVVAIFCEEGISGADDNRPEWKKSLLFCECGHTDIVFCKSQSRFSRSMEMIEKYLHTKFVEWNIRFVGLVDNTDTAVKGNKKARQINALTNEWAVEDQSINTRDVLRSKKENGLYAIAFAPYGYMKDPNDKYHLIIDDEAAEVVKRIYDMYINKGYGAGKIKNILNAEKVPTPWEYRHLHGSKMSTRATKKIINYQTEKNDTIRKLSDRFFVIPESIIKINKIEEDIFISDEEDILDRIIKPNIILEIPKKILWQSDVIMGILRNEIYTGTLVGNRYRNKSYKDKTRLKVPKEEWIRVPHCHTPIIPKEVWEKVNKACEEHATYKQRTKPDKNGEVHVFSRLVYCDCCGSIMHKEGGIRKGEYFLRCKQNKNSKGSYCSNGNFIYSKKLKALMLEKINEQLKKYYDMEKVEKNYYEKKINENTNNRIEIIQKEINSIDKIINKKSNMLNILYEDRVNGIITADEFASLKNQNDLDITEQKSRKEILMNEIADLEIKKSEKMDGKKIFEKYKEIKEINRTIINEFVSKILVGKVDPTTKKRKITIIWNFEEC